MQRPLSAALPAPLVRLVLVTALAAPVLACSGLKDAFNRGATAEAQRGAAKARAACERASPSRARTDILTLLGQIDVAIANGTLNGVVAGGVVGGVEGACKDGAVEPGEVQAARALFTGATG